MEQRSQHSAGTSTPIDVPQQKGFSLREKIRQMRINLSSRDVDPAVFDVLSPFCGRGVEKPRQAQNDPKLHTVKEGVEHTTGADQQGRGAAGPAAPGYTFSPFDRLKEKVTRETAKPIVLQQSTVTASSGQNPAARAPWGHAGGLQQAMKGVSGQNSGQAQGQSIPKPRLPEKDELRQELEANW